MEGRVLTATRVGVWILFLLAFANGVWLYLVPRSADRYAWPIAPPVNAAFIGGGFLAGTLATALVLFGTSRWRWFSTLPPGLWVLATTLLAATLIHNDRFKWHYPPTYVWLIVYAGVPIAVPVLVMLQRRFAGPKPPPDPRLRTLRAISALVGVVLLAGAIALFAAPVDLGKHWPWPLTPLLGRAVAAWYALFGTMLVSCALGLRRASEAVIPYATLAAWCLLLLALPLEHSGDVDTGATAFWPWMAVMVVLLALALHALSRSPPAGPTCPGPRSSRRSRTPASRSSCARSRTAPGPRRGSRRR